MRNWPIFNHFRTTVYSILKAMTKISRRMQSVRPLALQPMEIWLTLNWTMCTSFKCIQIPPAYRTMSWTIWIFSIIVMLSSIKSIKPILRSMRHHRTNSGPITIGQILWGVEIMTIRKVPIKCRWLNWIRMNTCRSVYRLWCNIRWVIDTSHTVKI